jgi:16S rRNA (guanine527-N7)-methyltransferase
LALKGQLPEDELKEISDKFDLVEIIKLKVPHLVGERHIIKIRKK